LPARLIDEEMVRSMSLVRLRNDDWYDLMINNKVFRNFILPNPRRTDVRDSRNFIYTFDHVTSIAPTHIHQNVAACGGAHFVPPTISSDFANVFSFLNYSGTFNLLLEKNVFCPNVCSVPK